MATMTPSRAEELLAVDEAAAWFEYLEATHRQGVRYDEVEPWAWNRLMVRLGAVEARRHVLVDSPRRTNAAEGGSPASGDELSP